MKFYRNKPTLFTPSGCPAVEEPSHFEVVMKERTGQSEVRSWQVEQRWARYAFPINISCPKTTSRSHSKCAYTQSKRSGNETQRPFALILL